MTKNYLLKRLAIAGVLTLLSLFSSNRASATHAAGAELLYEWVSDSTYRFYWKFYRDCDGTTEPTSQTMCYYNSCNGQTYQATLNKIIGALPGGGTNGQEVVTGCPQYPTTCTNGSLPGYREWWYTADVTLPSRCNFWTFYCTLNARNNSITNLDNPGAQSIYVETTLNNVAAQGNSSPYFTVKPVPYMCANSAYCFNNGAVDPNGDSLVFDIIQPRSQGGGCSNPSNATNIAYATGGPVYNTTNNPISTNNTFSLNSQTGTFCFTPNIQQIGVLTLRVQEYRNGVLIGSVLRDIQIVVLPCNTQQPTQSLVQSTITGATFNANGVVQACVTQPMTFCFDLVSPDTSAVLVVTSNAAVVTPTATLTYTGVLTDSIRACFSWTPTPTDTGLRVLVVSVKDSSCKPPGVPIIQTFTFPINVNPITEILRDTAVCPNDTAQLRAFGGTQFQWSVLPGGSPITSLSCTNCNNPKAYPSVTTSYVVTSNLSSVCNKNIDTVTVTVVTPPVVNVGPDRTTCVNDTIQLNANLISAPGTQYAIRWTPAAGLSNDTIANPLASPVTTTTYYLSVVPNGLQKCAARDTLVVNVLTGFQVFNNDTAICLGASVQINAIGDNRYAYSWTPTGGVSAPGSLTPVLTPTTPTTYTLTARFPGCSDSVRRLAIDVQPVPTVTLGVDDTLCYGDTVTVRSLVSPAYNNYTYAWSPGGLLSSTTTPNPLFTALATTTLTLTVRTPAGCQDDDAITYSVIPAEFLTLSNDTALCPRDTAQLTVTGNAVSVAWTPNRYIDDTTSFTPRVAPVTTTRYFVSGRDASFCLDTGSVLVVIKPEAVLSLPDSVRIYPGESYQMDPVGNCLYFSWFPPLGLSSTSIANPVAQPVVNTRYVVDGRTEFGCTTRDSIDVFVNYDSYVDVANAFTPGSAPNGTIRVSTLGTVTLKKFVIYNRWGQKMFETSDVNAGWDGTLNGQPQPMGVYVYMVEAQTAAGLRFQKQGNITLIR